MLICRSTLFRYAVLLFCVKLAFEMFIASHYPRFAEQHYWYWQKTLDFLETESFRIFGFLMFITITITITAILNKFHRSFLTIIIESMSKFKYIVVLSKCSQSLNSGLQWFWFGYAWVPFPIQHMMDTIVTDVLILKTLVDVCVWSSGHINSLVWMQSNDSLWAMMHTMATCITLDRVKYDCLSSCYSLNYW